MSLWLLSMIEDSTLCTTLASSEEMVSFASCQIF